MAQPEFLYLVALGCVILASAAIPLSLEDYNIEGEIAICMSTPWLLCVGFTVIFSALFAKTRRVNDLVSRTKQGTLAPRKAHMSSLKALLRPFILLICNVAVLICWTVINPLRYARQDAMGTDAWNRVIATYGTCRADESSLPYVILLAVFNCGVLIVSNYEAYKARNLKSEFSESSYIGVALASLLQTMLIGAPVMALIQTQPLAQYLTACFMILVVSLGVLCLMFVPKIQVADQASKRALLSSISKDKQFLEQESSVVQDLPDRVQDGALSTPETAPSPAQGRINVGRSSWADLRFSKAEQLVSKMDGRVPPSIREDEEANDTDVQATNDSNNGEFNRAYTVPKVNFSSWADMHLVGESVTDEDQSSCIPKNNRMEDIPEVDPVQE